MSIIYITDISQIFPLARNQAMNSNLRYQKKEQKYGHKANSYRAIYIYGILFFFV